MLEFRSPCSAGGGDVDDATAVALLDHLFCGYLGHEVGGFEIQGNGAVKGYFVRLHKRLLAAPAGVVHDDVQFAKGIECLFQRGFTALPACQICPDGDGAASEVQNLLGSLLGGR